MEDRITIKNTLIIVINKELFKAFIKFILRKEFVKLSKETPFSPIRAKGSFTISLLLLNALMIIIIKGNIYNKKINEISDIFTII
jgi:hypothetical protein